MAVEKIFLFDHDCKGSDFLFLIEGPLLRQKQKLPEHVHPDLLCQILLFCVELNRFVPDFIVRPQLRRSSKLGPVQRWQRQH
jgi:hypothetical protein